MIDPASNTVYVANDGSSNVTPIVANAAQTPVPAGTNPIAVAVNPVTHVVYVANNGSGNVTVIDGANNQVATTVPVGAAPVAIAANPATGLVYVANQGSDSVTAFDTVVSSNITITDPLHLSLAAVIILT